MYEIESTFTTTMQQEQAKKMHREELYTAIAMGFIFFLAFAALYLAI